jgi:hypothetical protein
MCCAKIKNPFLGCRASCVKWIPLFLCRAAGPLVQTKLRIGPISCSKGCRRRLGIRKRSAYLSMPSHMRRNAILFQDSPVFSYRIQDNLQVIDNQKLHAARLTRRQCRLPARQDCLCLVSLCLIRTVPFQRRLGSWRHQ